MIAICYTLNSTMNLANKQKTLTPYRFWNDILQCTIHHTYENTMVRFILRGHHSTVYRNGSFDRYTHAASIRVAGGCTHRTGCAVDLYGKEFETKPKEGGTAAAAAAAPPGAGRAYNV